MAVPALTWIGVTPLTDLSLAPASRISCQLVGCQSSGRPALAKIFLLKYRTRPSVPPGTPYALSW